MPCSKADAVGSALPNGKKLAIKMKISTIKSVQGGLLLKIMQI
jgi:hypothetical protein